MEAQLQSYLQEKGVEDLLKDIVVELCKEVTLCRAGLARANAARALRVAIHSAAAHPLAERARPFRPSSLGAGTPCPSSSPLSLLARLAVWPHPLHPSTSLNPASVAAHIKTFAGRSMAHVPAVAVFTVWSLCRFANVLPARRWTWPRNACAR